VPSAVRDYRAAGEVLSGQDGRRSAWILRDGLVLSFASLRTGLRSQIMQRIDGVRWPWFQSCLQPVLDGGGAAGRPGRTARHRDGGHVLPLCHQKVDVMNRIEGPKGSEAAWSPRRHGRDGARRDSAEDDGVIRQRVRAPRVRTFVARLPVRADVSPNTVTVAGTIGTIVGAIGFAARGQLHTATVIVAISSRCDLLDGEVARIGGRASRFGALLDSTLDRVADGVILASLTYWLFTTGNDRAAVAALLCLVAGQLVSDVRARA